MEDLNPNESPIEEPRVPIEYDPNVDKSIPLTCLPEEYAMYAAKCNEQGFILQTTDAAYVATPPPAPTLEELKTNLIAAFKARRDTEEVLPIAHGAYTYDFDDKARERLRIAQQALEDNNLPKQAWTTADNQSVELTVADFKAINTAAAVRSGQLHGKYNALKVQVNACITAEELNLIKWE